MIVRMAALVTATLFACASASAANMLVCPGFEVSEGAGDASAGDVTSNGSGWSGWNNWTPPYSAFITSAVAQNGAQASAIRSRLRMQPTCGEGSMDRKRSGSVERCRPPIRRK